MNIQYRNENHLFESPQKFAEIEIMDGCNLKCACCPRGLGIIPNNMRKMDLDLYSKIIDKCVSLGITGVSLFNWGEPFLNNELSEYCKIAYHRNMFVCLSSNLSFKNIDFLKILPYVNNLEISVSGFTQKIYKINHCGGKVRFVKNNIRMIEKLLGNGIQTNVNLKLFEYEYNKEDIKQWYNFLSKNSKINVLIVEGNCNPLKKDRYFGKIYNDTDVLFKTELKNNLYCNYARKICIDVNGKVVLCCEKIYDDSLIIGDFLNDDIYEMQIKKLYAKECDFCNVFHKQCNILRKKDLELIKRHKFI